MRVARVLTVVAVAAASILVATPAAAASSSVSVTGPVSPVEFGTVSVVRVEGVSRFQPVEVVWWDRWSTESVSVGRSTCGVKRAKRDPGACVVELSHVFGRGNVHYYSDVRVGGAVVSVVQTRVVRTWQPVEPTDWQADMLARVNALRAQVGAGPVRLCRPLMESAQVAADMMIRDQRFDHTGSDGSTPYSRAVAAGFTSSAFENFAAGRPNVAEAMGAWVNSPGHYANMVNPRHTMVGFGFTPASAAGPWNVWVQVFGTADC